MSIGMGYITVTRDGAILAIVPLDRETATIGRDADNDVVLDHPDVSRKHARIDRSPAGPVLTDLYSTHGTAIVGEPSFLLRPVVLREGMVVLIGPFELTYSPRESGLNIPIPPVSNNALPEPPPEPSRILETVQAPPLTGLSRYLEDLPVIFQPRGENLEETFLGRYLLILESLWEPLEQRQDHIEKYFDPRTCPAEFLPCVARWLDFDYESRLPEGRVRALLSRAMDLQRRRGTAVALADLVELCTGLRPEIVEDTDRPIFRVRLPRRARPQRELIEDLIRTHKPAHAGYRIEEQP